MPCPGDQKLKQIGSQLGKDSFTEKPGSKQAKVLGTHSNSPETANSQPVFHHPTHISFFQVLRISRTAPLKPVTCRLGKQIPCAIPNTSVLATTITTARPCGLQKPPGFILPQPTIPRRKTASTPRTCLMYAKGAEGEGTGQQQEQRTSCCT